jgi:hypothetical protein
MMPRRCRFPLRLLGHPLHASGLARESDSVLDRLSEVQVSSLVRLCVNSYLVSIGQLQNYLQWLSAARFPSPQWTQVDAKAEVLADGPLKSG